MHKNTFCSAHYFRHVSESRHRANAFRPTVRVGASRSWHRLEHRTRKSLRAGPDRASCSKPGGPHSPALTARLAPALERFLDVFAGQEPWQQFGQAAWVEVHLAVDDLGNRPPLGGHEVVDFFRSPATVLDRRLVR